MVDNALEFDVITADGVARTINQCNDPDLFYAMRGGGGSTYAVLLNYKFKVFPEVSMYFYQFTADFAQPQGPLALPVNNPGLYTAVSSLAKNQQMFVDNNVSSYNFYYPGSFETYQILPTDDADGMQRLKDLTASYKKTLESIPGTIIKSDNYTVFQHQTDFAQYTTPIAVRNTPQGFAEVLAGRFIPDTMFQSNDSIDTLTKAFLTGYVVPISSLMSWCSRPLARKRSLLTHFKVSKPRKTLSTSSSRSRHRFTSQALPGPTHPTRTTLPPA